MGLLWKIYRILCVGGKDECKTPDVQAQTGTDRCICCGAPIPEGRQICFRCEHEEG